MTITQRTKDFNFLLSCTFSRLDKKNIYEWIVSLLQVEQAIKLQATSLLCVTVACIQLVKQCIFLWNVWDRKCNIMMLIRFPMKSNSTSITYYEVVN